MVYRFHLVIAAKLLWVFDVTDLKYVYRCLVNSLCSKTRTVVPEVYNFIVLFEVQCFYTACCYFGKHLKVHKLFRSFGWWTGISVMQGAWRNGSQAGELVLFIRWCSEIREGFVIDIIFCLLCDVLEEKCLPCMYMAWLWQKWHWEWHFRMPST